MSITIEQSLNSYVTDMLALEEHIDQALEGQIGELKDDDGDVVQVLRSFRAHIASHILQLKAMRLDADESIGGKVAESVKRAISVVAGLGAAAVDALRTEQVAKDLRDDYAAFNMASIGYVMMHTSAASLGNRAMAEMAQVCQRDYAAMIATLRRTIPATVIRVLRGQDLPADASVLRQVLEVQDELARLTTMPRPEFATAGR